MQSSVIFDLMAILNAQLYIFFLFKKNSIQFSLSSYDPSSGPLHISFDAPRAVRNIRLWVDRQVSDVRVTAIAPDYVSQDAPDITDEKNAAMMAGAPPVTGSTFGDPHFKTWGGGKFDFQ